MNKIICMIVGVSLILITACQQVQTDNTVCVSECEPCVASDITIFNFESQEIPAQCRGENPQDDFLPIWFNSSLKIIKRNGLEIEQIGLKKIIFPSFFTYLEDRHPKLWLKDIECRVEGNFKYNVTINGESITDFHYVSYEDCSRYYQCGIEKMIMEKYSD